MIANLIYFLPSITCILWATIYKFRRKNRTQIQLYRVMSFAIVYFTCFAVYINPYTDYMLMAVLNYISQPTILAVLGMTSIYIYVHSHRKEMPPLRSHLLYVPAIFQLSVNSIFYLLLGFSNYSKFLEMIDKVSASNPDTPIFDALPKEYCTDIHQLVYFFDNYVYESMAGVFFVVIIGQTVKIFKKEDYRFGDIFKFWLKDEYTTIGRAVSFLVSLVLLSATPKLILGRTYIMNHPVLGSVMSILLTFFLYSLFFTEFFSSLRRFKLHDLTHIDIFGSENRSAKPQNADNVQINEPNELQNTEEVSDGSESLQAELPDDELASQDMQESVMTEEKDDLSANKEEVCEDEEEELSEELNVSDETEEQEEEPEEEPYQDEQIVRALSAKENKLVSRLDEILGSKLYYTDNELTMETLARMLGTNRTTISTIINQRYGMNFKTLIATRRIEEAKRMLADDPSMPIEAIATECGYKDKVNFYRRFKEITGDTPRVWISKRGK